MALRALLAIPALHALFFLSGVSGLIYQVVWARAFGTVFGNTVHSTSLVVAIFMLGLGAGSYAGGVWADRRYARAPESLIRAYGYAELAIALLGLVVSLAIPRLATLSAASSSYMAGEHGWFVLSPVSHLARGVIAVLLLVPITTLMGATLTLLVRHRVRHDVETAGGWKIALLYGVNTAGAAAGALLADFFLIPAAGLLATQLTAVALGVVAAAGALVLGAGGERGAGQARGAGPRRATRTTSPTRPTRPTSPTRPAWIVLALALAGFAAMGMEILWLRHFTLLLGGFRAVFSLLLAVILIGIGVGSLVGGFIGRRTARPAPAFMVTQALFVAFVLIGLQAADVRAIAADARTIDALLGTLAPSARWVTELWYNARPILLEAGLPSLLMGCSFPLANAIIQQAERSVGRRAGALYLANTIGAVCGSLAAGFILLPALGIQSAATLLISAAALAILPLYVTTRSTAVIVASALIAGVSIGAWLRLPDDHLVRRAMVPQSEGDRVIAISEGLTELVAVTESPGRGRGLMTNGHAMSSTAPLDQRYMRALAHIPLLSMERPTRVLVIGFGVGNTAHAATLHPSVERVDVADLSRHVLEHADYFRDANRGVLADPRVRVYVNDGRLHLQMEPEGVYDLITLEPPPVAHAGVAALYSREFYALARTRLKAGGYLSQWLPAYQVPADASLAMVRALIDVFPQSVLLSGAQAELLLVGINGPAIAIDPMRVAHSLAAAPGVQVDLQRLDLGTPTEIVGTFVGSARTLAGAASAASAATDDRPVQEYAVRSAVGTGLRGVPASLFDLGAVADWCPRCVDGDISSPWVPGLEPYLALLDHAYRSPVADVAAARAAGGSRQILGSTYLGAVVPDNDAVRTLAGEAHYEIGSDLLDRGEFAQAATHFRAAALAIPDSAPVHNNLGVALASMGDVQQASEHFRRAVELDPAFEQARRNLAAARRR